MKKLLMMILALCLCLSAACAETTVEAKDLEAYSLELNAAANTFLLRDGNTRAYRVVDADLEPLSDDYLYISISGGYYKAANEEGLTYGLLDGQGKLIIPMEYCAFEVLSDRWIAAVKVVEATSENYDYKVLFAADDVNPYYLTDTVDLWYNGELKGTLTRPEWGNAYPYGDYLYVRDRDGKCSFFNSKFEKTTAETDSYREYDEDYKTKSMFHQGSNQTAFTAGCTLTEEEVKQSVWVNYDRQLVDLQGNVIADLSGYYTANVDADSNLVKIRNEDGKHGVLDATGKEIVPCVYDSIDYDLADALKSGYLYAVKDGMGGFVNLATGAETGFTFPESACKNRANFIVADDRDGKVLISAAAGELPGRYQEADVPYNSASPFAAVKDPDGRVHVIGMLGEEILPDNPDIKNTYNVSFSADGSLILVQDIDRLYHIYRVSGTYDIPSAEPDAEAQPDTWICANCGTENHGKFCTECGSPRPEEKQDDSWTCENGHEGNTGKFCSECGAPRPEQ